MYPVWIELVNHRILLGWISCAVLQDIDRRGIGEGENLQLVVDQRHHIEANEILPVRDLWVPMWQIQLSPPN